MQIVEMYHKKEKKEGQILSQIKIKIYQGINQIHYLQGCKTLKEKALSAKLM